MSRLGRLFWPALLSGLIAGVMVAGLQQIFVTPLIVEAETLESARAASGSILSPAHDAQTQWMPESGVERALYTALADVGVGVGYALLLGAGLALTRETGRPVGWKIGVAWGLAGFAVFVLAPALGLAPELPGGAAAGLEPRQAWWALTALCTATGIASIAFAERRLWILALGAALLALPHLVGAPVPPEPDTAAIENLRQRFVPAALLVNLTFWLFLGALSGWLQTPKAYAR